MNKTANIETSSGIYTYQESIRKALNEFAKLGIDVVQYENGRTLGTEEMFEELLTQYVVAYKRNGKWYRDSERHQNIKTATKRLNELKNKGKYEDYKIVYREITLWRDYEN